MREEPRCQAGSRVVSGGGRGWEKRISLAFSLLPSSRLSQQLLHPALHQGKLSGLGCANPGHAALAQTLPGAVPSPDCSSRDDSAMQML